MFICLAWFFCRVFEPYFGEFGLRQCKDLAAAAQIHSALVNKDGISTSECYTRQIPCCKSSVRMSLSRYSPTAATLATSHLPVRRSLTSSKWAGTRIGKTADQTVERSTLPLLTSIVIHQSKAIILLLMKFQFAFSAFHIDIFHIATALW